MKRFKNFSSGLIAFLIAYFIFFTMNDLVAQLIFYFGLSIIGKYIFRLTKFIINKTGNLDCDCNSNLNRLFKQYARTKEENTGLQERIASIIYSLTGGRLSYSTHTLEGCEQVYHDQLEIDVERATKELEEKLQAKEKECEELETMVAEAEEAPICFHCSEEPCIRQEKDKYKQTLDEIGKLIPKFDTSDGCSYGDYDCENCSDLDEDIVCAYKLKKVIKGIIDKVKENK